jgi:hypothetical protein
MDKTATQRAAHTFLLEHFLSGETFTLDDFEGPRGGESQEHSIRICANNIGD